MNSLKTCIICGKPIKDKSIEHIIPDAIGGNITIDTVCKDCNSKLGDRVDSKLTNSMMFEWIRHELNIKNRDGKAPNLYKYYKGDDGKPIAIIHGDGENTPEVYTGDCKPVFEIVKNSDKSFTVVRFSGASEEAIIKRGVKEFKEQGFPVPESIVRAMVLSGIERNWTTQHVEIGIKYEPLRYLPCYVKMAYEVMRTLFPQYAQDPRCEELRLFLYQSAQGTYNNDFSIKDIKQYGVENQEPDPVYNAYLSVDDEKLLMVIDLFNKAMMLIPVSDYPDRYPVDRYEGVNLFDQIGNLAIENESVRKNF